jgi:acylphosphatase
MKSVRIILHGKVQGVGFRYYAYRKAMEHQIRGFARNSYDGSVLIEATGTEESLEEFIDWCSEGPPRAQVEKISINSIPFEDFKEFTVG